MHNCPQGGQHCRRFWAFFKDTDQTPVEYFNEDGIGERVMRRIVFDCDRCGKRDVNPTYSRYGPEGEGEEHLLDEAARKEVMGRHGYNSNASERAVFDLLVVFEEEKTWQHYCPRCFKTILDSVGKLLQEKPPSRGPARGDAGKDQASEVPGAGAEDGEQGGAAEAEPEATAASAPRVPSRASRRAARPS